MAVLVPDIRTFTGFETGDGSGVGLGTGPLILDGTARTGCYYHRTRLGYPSNGDQGQLLISGQSISLGANEFAYGACRLYMRITQAPNAAQTIIILGGQTVNTQDIRLILNSDLTWSIKVSTGSSGPPGGTQPLALNVWHKVELFFQFPQDYAGHDGLAVGSGSVDNISSGTVVAGGSGFIGFSGFRSVGWGALGTVNTVTQGIIEWDDIILQWAKNASATTLPPSTVRSRLVPIIGQSTPAAWTGSYTNIQKIPIVGSGLSQTSSSAGAATVFQHQTGIQLGARRIHGIRIFGGATRGSSSSTEKIRYGATDYNVTVGTSLGSATPQIFIWPTDPAIPFIPADFDSSNFGMVNSTGAALTLWGMFAEILYEPNGANWFVCQGVTAVSSVPAAPPYTSAPLPPATEFELDLASGGIKLGSSALQVLSIDPSGIYTLVKNKTRDTLYDRQGSITSTDVKIPNPFAKTGYFGG